jgi:hypothetical protein
MKGVDSSVWVYACSVSLGSESLKQAYGNLVSLVQASRPDWHIANFADGGMEFKGQTSPRSVRVYYTNDDGSNGGVLNFRLFSPSTARSALPSAPAKVGSTIDSEIASVLSSNRYSALPVLLATPDQSRSPELSTVTITNATRYNLRILVSGPTSGQYSIPAGATQDVPVSAGSYRLLGRVSAPNVLPFYGSPTYASGMKYLYRFFIQ